MPDSAAESRTTPPSPPFPALLPWQGLLDLLAAQRFSVGVSELLRMEVVLRKLPPDMPPEQYKDLKYLLAPIFATSSEQQEKFYALCDSFLAAYAPARETPPRPPQPDPRPWLRPALLLAAVLAIVLAYPAYQFGKSHRMFWAPGPPPQSKPKPNPKPDSGTQNPGKEQAGTPPPDPGPTDKDKPPAVDAVPAPSPPIPHEFVIEVADRPHGMKPDIDLANTRSLFDLYGWKAILIALLTPAAIAWLILWLRRRRAPVKRRTPPFRWPLKVDPPERSLHDLPAMMETARRMRTRQTAEHDLLDVDRSIERTIGEGGFPTLVRRPAMRRPEYLVLIDRHSMRDHLAAFYAELVRTFKREGIHAEYYYFDDDLRLCRGEQSEESIEVAQLAARFGASHRLMVIADGRRLLDPVTGRLPEWMSLFLKWKERALFLPEALPESLRGLSDTPTNHSRGYPPLPGSPSRPPQQAPAPRGYPAGEGEDSVGAKVSSPSHPLTPSPSHPLASLFWLLPASFEGLRAFLERLAGDERAHAELPDSFPIAAPRLTERFSEERLEALRRYLGEDGYLWLRLCALYPELRWNLTLFLSTLPSLAAQTRPRETAERLSRLEWFRAGVIPDAWRWELMRRLPEGAEHEARAALVRLMEGEPPPAGSYAEEAFQLELALQRWAAEPTGENRQQLGLQLGQMRPEEIRRRDVLMRMLKTERPRSRRHALRRWLERLLWSDGIPELGYRPSARAALGIGLAAACLALTFIRMSPRTPQIMPIDAPVVHLEKLPIDLGIYEPGMEGRLTIRIQNKSAKPFRASDVAVEPPGAFALDPKQDRNLVVPPKAEKPIVVTFDPQKGLTPNSALPSAEKTHTARLTFRAAGSSGMHPIPLTAVVTQHPDLAVEPRNLQFAETDPPKLMKITNRDRQAVRVTVAVESRSTLHLVPGQQAIGGVIVVVNTSRDSERGPSDVDMEFSLKPGESIQLPFMHTEDLDDSPPSKVEIRRKLLSAGVGSPETYYPAMVSLSAPPSHLRSPKDGAEMVYVPAGAFTMGDKDQSDNPPHKVTLSGYYIYKNLVTVANYRKFCSAKGHTMPPAPPWGWKEDHPIVNVDWNDAQEYCKWAGVRLPTEAEWEKAARGTDGRLYPWGNAFDSSKLQHSEPNAADAMNTAPVGSFPSGASPYGALDMAGNVSEWCVDWYDKAYTKNSNLTNPTGPDSGNLRVLRGGSWLKYRRVSFRASNRDSDGPANWSTGNGFRCAISGPIQSPPEVLVHKPVDVAVPVRAKTNATDGAEMVYVPAGAFTMGDTDQRRNPPHKVALSGYYVYKNLVTVAQYREFCTATGHKLPEAPIWGWKDNHPIVNVSWTDAQTYCKWADVRLPTEAEWEKAARGTDGWKYPWGNDFDYSKLQCSKSKNMDAKGTAPVGSFPTGASPYGALDMAGNVWEWCADWYSDTYTVTSNLSNPAGPSSGKNRVLRGGSWYYNSPVSFRSSTRNYNNPGLRADGYGFRCVASVPIQSQTKDLAHKPASAGRAGQSKTSPWAVTAVVLLTFIVIGLVFILLIQPALKGRRSELGITSPSSGMGGVAILAHAASDWLQTRRTRRYLDILKEVKWALVFTCVLIGLNMLVEKTMYGVRLKWLAYYSMKQRLPAVVDGANLPIIIVDISELANTGDDEVTSRTGLRDLITAIARHHPKAIGVDIDASPRPYGHSMQTEIDFLEFCNDLSTGRDASGRQHDPVPIYLGVGRTANGPSEGWLGLQRFAPMAVGVQLGFDEQFRLWNPIESAGGDRLLKSMSAALAEAAESHDQLRERETPRWLDWALESKLVYRTESGLRGQWLLVDYSPLESLSREVVSMGVVLRSNDPSRTLSDKIVLIGNASDTADKMSVPDRTRAVPGVLIHACATYTLLGHQLNEPTLAGRIAADLLLGLVILIVLTVRKRWNAARDQPELPNRHFDERYPWLRVGILLVTLLGGVIFVYKTGIIWDDFPLVAIGLIYPPPVERFLHGLLRRRQKANGGSDDEKDYLPR